MINWYQWDTAALRAALREQVVQLFGEQRASSDAQQIEASVEALYRLAQHVGDAEGSQPFFLGTAMDG
jgi:hypothetical protein